jgi:hypothetical protein
MAVNHTELDCYVERLNRDTVADLSARNAPGICFQKTSPNIVMIDKRIIEAESMKDIGDLLAYEIMHAVGTFMPYGASIPGQCFEQELLSFKWEAHIFDAMLIAPFLKLHPMFASPVHRDRLRMVNEWRADNLQPRVLLTKTFQRNCLGRELVQCDRQKVFNGQMKNEDEDWDGDARNNAKRTGRNGPFRAGERSVKERRRRGEAEALPRSFSSST